jgi:Flp pilus assembly protein TadG
MAAFHPLRALKLLRDERGTSLVEFAFVAPVLGLFLVGIADYSRGFAERYALEAAASRTLERAILGTSISSTTGTNTDDYAFLRDEAAAAAGVPVANVTYTPRLYCDGVEQASFNDVCNAGQEISRYIYIRIIKDFVPSFTWTGAAIPIEGDASVRIQ